MSNTALDQAYADLQAAAAAQVTAQQTATDAASKFAASTTDLNLKKAATQKTRDAFNKVLDSSLLPPAPAAATPAASAAASIVPPAAS